MPQPTYSKRSIAKMDGQVSRLMDPDLKKRKERKKVLGGPGNVILCSQIVSWLVDILTLFGFVHGATET
jgi:hypothetical protein